MKKMWRELQMRSKEAVSFTYFAHSGTDLLIKSITETFVDNETFMTK